MVNTGPYFLECLPSGQNGGYCCCKQNINIYENKKKNMKISEHDESDRPTKTYRISGRQTEDDNGRTLVIVYERPEVAGRVFDRPFRDDVLSRFGIALREKSSIV